MDDDDDDDDERTNERWLVGWLVGWLASIYRYMYYLAVLSHDDRYQLLLSVYDELTSGLVQKPTLRNINIALHACARLAHSTDHSSMALKILTDMDNAQLQPDE